MTGSGWLHVSILGIVIHTSFSNSNFLTLTFLCTGGSGAFNRKVHNEDEGQKITVNYHSVWVSFMSVARTLNVSYAVSLQIASLVQSMLQSTLSDMAAGETSRLYQYDKLCMFCAVLFYTDCTPMCNFDSYKNFTCYMMCNITN